MAALRPPRELEEPHSCSPLEHSERLSFTSGDRMSVRLLASRNERHLARSFNTNTESDDLNINVNETESQGQRRPLLGQNSVHYSSIYDSEEFSSHRNGMEVIRRRLKSHFMSPYQKFKHRGRKPWKLLLQLIKIIIVTVQVCVFGNELFSVVDFMENNLDTFQHLFVQNYTKAHPEATTIYTRDQFYIQVRHALFQYYAISENAVGVYSPPIINGSIQAPMNYCTYSYNKGYVDPGNRTYKFDHQTNYTCVNLLPPSKEDHDITKFRIRNNLPLQFERYIFISLIAEIRTLHLQENPQCYKFNITITFDNSMHDGKIPVVLDTKADSTDCDDDLTDNFAESSPGHYLLSALDLIVLTVCAISMALCVRSLVRHSRLVKSTRRFFKDQLSDHLSYWDCLDLINLWFILIFISDTCTILGSIFKILIDWEVLTGTNYDTCSIFLGTGVLLTWTGVLRYLGYMRTYNILLVTLKASGPSVLRFVVCAALLYFGFMFCGWIVLGPYHPKFRTLSVVSECMFSLINGDDMFMTFKEMQDRSMAVWIFSKIYLYVFISLFIYVVLSLFIGIISDTYERIKDWGHPPCTKLERFVHGPNCQRCANEYRDEDSNSAEDTDMGTGTDGANTEGIQ